MYTAAKEHEAGYDSYITGVCFVALAKEIKVNVSEMTSKNPHLRSYLNK